MRESLLDFLRCPECIAALHLRAERREDQEVLTGELACSQCAAKFAVEAGVPRMLRAKAPTTRTQRSFGKQWLMHSQGSFERDLIYSKSREECLEDFRRAFNLQDLEALSELFDSGRRMRLR